MLCMLLLFCMLLVNFVNYVFFMLCYTSCILIVMCVPFLVFYFICFVLYTVCVQMCTVLLPPGVNSIAVNKYITS